MDCGFFATCVWEQKSSLKKWQLCKEDREKRREFFALSPNRIRTWYRWRLILNLRVVNVFSGNDKMAPVWQKNTSPDGNINFANGPACFFSILGSSPRAPTETDKEWWRHRHLRISSFLYVWIYRELPLHVNNLESFCIYSMEKLTLSGDLDITRKHCHFCSCHDTNLKHHNLDLRGDFAMQVFPPSLSPPQKWVQMDNLGSGNWGRERSDQISHEVIAKKILWRILGVTSVTKTQSYCVISTQNRVVKTCLWCC